MYEQKRLQVKKTSIPRSVKKILMLTRFDAPNRISGCRQFLFPIYGPA